MPAAALRIAAIALLSGSARGSSDTRRCPARQRQEIDGLSALQTPAARHSSGLAPHGREAEELQRASDEVHIVSVSGCKESSVWETELLFYSAQYVGQRGPITAIVHGCDPQREKHIRDRYASLGLPDHYKVHFLPELNDERSKSISKPYGFAKWFAEAGPERDIVACVDPDFIFTRPLTGVVEPELAPKYYKEAEVSTDTGRKERVRKGVVAANRWTTVHKIDYKGNMSSWMLPRPFGREPDDRFRGWTDREILTWICSGSRTGQSGCTGITEHEVGNYHATGPPYLAHKDDWAEWLAQDWHDITERLHSGTVFPSFFVDMFSWALANMHKGRRQLVVRNLVVTQREFYSDWSGIMTGTADPCDAPMDVVFSQPNLPNFVHYTGFWEEWNKRWLHENVFERCDAAAPEDEAGLAKLNVTWTHDKSERSKPKNLFICCVARRFLAAGIKRACKGQPAAALVETMSAGFAF